MIWYVSFEGPITHAKCWNLSKSSLDVQQCENKEVESSN